MDKVDKAAASAISCATWCRPSRGGGSSASGGGLLDILGQILGQATSGVKEGAQRADDATGASGQLRDILTKATGKSPEELMNHARELVEKNKMGAGVAAGGLGAVVLGTNTGRALVGSALKIGALALIGGLAYKAVQNFQAGKPVLDGGGQPQALVEAPSGPATKRARSPTTPRSSTSAP